MQGWTENENAFSADPLFVNIDDPIGPDGIWLTADDGLRLKSGSPAIDAGIDTDLFSDISDIDNDGNTTELLPSDILGHSRIQGSAVDLGAYEFLKKDIQITYYSVAVSASHGGTVTAGGNTSKTPLLHLRLRHLVWVIYLVAGAEMHREPPTL